MPKCLQSRVIRGWYAAGPAQALAKTTPRVGLFGVKTWCQSAFPSFWLSIDGLRSRPALCDDSSLRLFSCSSNGPGYRHLRCARLGPCLGQHPSLPAGLKFPEIGRSRLRKHPAPSAPRLGSGTLERTHPRTWTSPCTAGLAPQMLGYRNLPRPDLFELHRAAGPLGTSHLHLPPRSWPRLVHLSTLQCASRGSGCRKSTGLG